MTVRHHFESPQRRPQYSQEEFAQRGDAIHESQVRAQVEAGNHGKIVAIDALWLTGSKLTCCILWINRWESLHDSDYNANTNSLIVHGKVNYRNKMGRYVAARHSILARGRQLRDRSTAAARSVKSA
jgi:hypothetical protein